MPLKPGHTHSDRWDTYVAKLSEATTAKRILEELDQELVADPAPTARLAESAARARVLEWNGEELPERTVLLTFDDGPHPIHTPAIDSEDWADPLPESIAHRVVQEAEKAGRGIVLLHDVHARTVEALPIVIQELKNRTFRFARWNGQKLVVDPRIDR